MNKLKTIGKVLLGVLALGALGACKGPSGGGGVFNKSTGRPGEVMLVMPSEYMDTPVGHKLVRMLEQPAPALNQEEPSFTVSRVNREGFKDFLRLVRSEILVDIDPERYSTTSLKYNYDEWAEGQIVLRLNSSSPDSLESYLERNEEAIMNMLTRHELYLFAKVTAEKPSQRVRELADSLFGLRVDMPLDIRSAKVGESFLWMSNAQMRRRHDILLYTFPYRSKADIGLDRLVQVRDSVLRVNIEGEFEGSYPATFLGGLVYRKVSLPGQEMRGEVRGLWEMRGGAMMGGPFVMQAYIDEEAGKVVVIEGFVYHPNEDKRDMIRLMEAGLYSLRPSGEVSFDPKKILEASYTRSF